MAQTIIPNDTVVNGILSCRQVVPSETCITNAHVRSDAAIAATKLDHQHQPVFAQNHGSAASAQRQVMHVARGAGTIVNFRAGVSVACIGDSTITVNLYKNGSTVLTGAIVLDNGNAAFAKEDAPGFTSTTIAAGDVFEAVIAVSAGTGTLGQGLFCELTVREGA
jgi:hypothetical protein